MLIPDGGSEYSQSKLLFRDLTSMNGLYTGSRLFVTIATIVDPFISPGRASLPSDSGLPRWLGFGPSAAR
jgi:hypothetical protein